MYILGIIGDAGTDCHDSAAALFEDNKIVAAAEQERFSRRKHADGEAPYDAVMYCLKSQNITLDDVKHIAISWVPKDLKGELSEEEKICIMNDFFPKSIFKYSKKLSFSFVNHHLTHLAQLFTRVVIMRRLAW